jgi:hypothetical protein
VNSTINISEFGLYCGSESCRVADSCNATADHNASFAQYGLMRDALNKTGRPIYFDLCGWSSPRGR